MFCASFPLTSFNSIEISHAQPDLRGFTLTCELSFDIDSSTSEDLKFEIGTYSAPLNVPGRPAFTNMPFLRTLGRP